MSPSLRQPDSKTDSGAYQILFMLKRKRLIQIGRLGRFMFPAGYYIYTGSALKNLEKRVSRHLSKEKKKRWHIDYLIGFAEVLKYRKYLLPNEGECAINQKTSSLKGAEIIVPGFGSSDCRECRAHLVHFKKIPDLF